MIEGIKHDFQSTVWDYYHTHGRHDLPWRIADLENRFDPYNVTVSELMLQQTQVSRVIPKYQAFLIEFPTVVTLAQAPLGDVLRAWSGLGYNRRAKFLHQAAQQVLEQYEGIFPHDISELTKLPGIGSNTAGAVAAYAFNQPVVFIETNIRTVFIHHFFRDAADISDKMIHELVGDTLDAEHPREWYWALMDYGAHLKQTVGNLNNASAHYKKQSTFHGSRRQIRGQVIGLLGGQALNLDELQQHISDDRLATVLEELLTEGLIRQNGSEYLL